KDYLKYTEPDFDINSVSKSVFVTNDAEVRFKFFKKSLSSVGVVQSSAQATVANFLITDTSISNQSTRNQIAFWASHYHHITIINTMISASIRQEIVDNKPLPFIPSLGFNTKLHKYFNIYGKIGRVYRIPTLNDLYWIPGGNPTLKPESGWAGELSGEFNRKTKKVDFTTSVTAFGRIIENWILWQPVSSQLWSPLNIGKVYSRGIEIRGNFKIFFTKNLSGRAGFSFDYTKSENKDINSTNFGKQLLYVPFVKSSLFVGLLPGYGFTILLNGIIVGKRYVSSDNLDFTPYYTLINFALSRDLKFKTTGITIFGKINNILDKYYETIIWRPMPGINYELGIRVNF
ncbi:MAG: TonB-dependent receptor domain-containing protein, partial [Bacteroidia bacterium]